MLGLFWLLFPLRLHTGDGGASTGACLRMADHPPEAGVSLAQLEQCVTVVPADVELRADLGAAYERAGRAADAEKAYRQVLDLDADHADVRVKLARLLLKRGEAAEARTQAERALQTQPNRQSIRDLIAETTP